MNRWKQCLVAVFLSLALALVALPALAQTELGINLRRNVGYGAGSQIRGSFSIDVTNSEGLKSVTYLIDGQVMKEFSAPPFKFTFNTDQYPSGWHTLSATAVTTDGRTLQAQSRSMNFLSAEQEKAAMGSTVFPILGGAVGIIVLVALGQFLIFRNRKREPVPLGEHRHYGLHGGAICPRCHRPFPLHWYAMNAGLRSKLDTCENCGRFGIFHPASSEALARAEAAEVQDAQATLPVHEMSEAEQLKQQIDSSRYEDI